MHIFKTKVIENNMYTEMYRIMTPIDIEKIITILHNLNNFLLKYVSLFHQLILTCSNHIYISGIKVLSNCKRSVKPYIQNN